MHNYTIIIILWNWGDWWQNIKFYQAAAQQSKYSATILEKNNIVLICIHTKELSITFNLNICKEDHETFIATQVYVHHFVLFASHFYFLGGE